MEEPLLDETQSNNRTVTYNTMSTAYECTCF